MNWTDEKARKLSTGQYTIMRKLSIGQVKWDIIE